jgi:DNA primase
MSKCTFVDFRAVKRDVSMVQVLEHYGLMGQMHQNGDSISGACPIHGGENKTAFRVSISKNCWNCFSTCQCGGNVLDFVAKKEDVSLLKAANLLVSWFELNSASNHKERDSRPNVNTAKAAPSMRDKSKYQGGAIVSSSTLQVNEAEGENKPLGFELKNLQPEHPYLEERGLIPATVQTFGLGFCTKGLLKDRIAIPIHNANGQLVAYAGRWPGQTEKEKYQLPKGFKKSLELFNLHRTVAEGPGPLIITEGFFDCLALWQHGHKRVVALMGSSMSHRQEELIREHTTPWSNVLIMLDEDAAGRAGREDVARRLARWLFVKVHAFPTEGMQPDQISGDEIEQLFGGAS